jgi:GlcNAc-P-P-Und epimerase
MIFFIGASGFIGSHFHEMLPPDSFVNMDLEAPKFPTNAPFIKGDVRIKANIEAVLAQYPIDTIINLAAEHKDFGIDEAAYFKTNEQGTRNVCEAATQFGIKKIVFFSSVAVYGNNQTPSNEAMPPAPNMPYGASKWAAEKVLEKWVNEGLERAVLIIRPALVYGERNVANMFRLIEQIKKGRYFHIGAGKNVKSIAYVKNVVGATQFLKTKMTTGMQVFNYADTPQYSSHDIAATISQALEQKEPTTLPYWLVYLMALPFDLAIKITGKDLPISTNRVKKFCTETYHKADKILSVGFQPQYTNQDGLKKMVAWMNSDTFEEEAIFDV